MKRSLSRLHKKLTHTLPYPYAVYLFPPGFQHSQGTERIFLTLLLLCFFLRSPQGLKGESSLLPFTDTELQLCSSFSSYPCVISLLPASIAKTLLLRKRHLK